MKRMLIGTVVAAALLAVPAQAHLGTNVVIRHQTRGCHAWSVNGGAFKASQVVRIARGNTITFTNNDVMFHKLVKTRGPAVVIRHAKMAHFGAIATVRFTKAGVYKFKTKFGEDYKGIKVGETIGEDNLLRLTVHVT